MLFAFTWEISIVNIALSKESTEQSINTCQPTKACIVFGATSQNFFEVGALNQELTCQNY